MYHGTEGPVVVDDMASTLLADKFVLAGQELGFEHVDVTAQKQFGEYQLRSLMNLTTRSYPCYTGQRLYRP